MRYSRSVFAFLFVLVMLCFILFTVWYIPALGKLSFQIQDVQSSLETSKGRERKQQHEYDETAAEIPVVRNEIQRITPQAEAAKEEVASLKAERKRLREEKKALEARIADQTVTEVGADD